MRCDTGEATLNADLSLPSSPDAMSSTGRLPTADRVVEPHDSKHRRIRSESGAEPLVSVDFNHLSEGGVEPHRRLDFNPKSAGGVEPLKGPGENLLTCLDRGVVPPKKVCLAKGVKKH